MSQTPTMSGQEAHSLLMLEVFAPAFMDKLASHGIVPQTEEEAIHYLSMGQKLLAADQHEQVKQAYSRVGFLKQAEADLDREFQRRYGVRPTTGVRTPEEEYIKKAAAYLGTHPTIIEAVAAYNEAVAAEEARLAGNM